MTTHTLSDSAHAWAEFEALLEAVAAGAFERERDDVRPFDAMDLVRRHRMGALRVPTRYGGAGVSLRELFSAVIRLAAVDPNVAHILRYHFWFVEERLAAPQESERERWLPEVVSSRIFGSAFTEIGGADVGGFGVAGMQTKLAHRDVGYVLNGKKYYTTGSLYADRTVVAAAGDGEHPTIAVVPTDRDGVTIEDDWDGFGQRLTGSGTAVFVDVAVQPDELLSSWDREYGYQGAFTQLYLSALIAGIIQAIGQDAAALVRGRTRTFNHASGDTPAQDPLLQQFVGQIESNAFAASTIVLAAADAIQAAADAVVVGAHDPERVAEASLRAAQAKIVIDELVQRSAWLLFEVGGASATKRSANLDRHWRNARTITSHNPTVYKTRAIGDLAINGTPLPASGFV
jgi:alkylation response protein AidB-like acyl-CoA dehydrogenase